MAVLPSNVNDPRFAQEPAEVARGGVLDNLPDRADEPMWIEAASEFGLRVLEQLLTALMHR